MASEDKIWAIRMRVADLRNRTRKVSSRGTLEEGKKASVRQEAGSRRLGLGQNSHYWPFGNGKSIRRRWSSHCVFTIATTYRCVVPVLIDLHLLILSLLGQSHRRFHTSKSANWRSHSCLHPAYYSIPHTVHAPPLMSNDLLHQITPTSSRPCLKARSDARSSRR